MTLTFYTIVCYGLLLFVWLPSRGRVFSPVVGGALLIALCLAVAIPVNGVNLSMAMRGITGDFAIVTACWLALVAIQRVTATPLFTPREAHTAALLVVAAALLLYPASMGLSQWDPYRMGYSLAMPAICCALVVALVFLRQTFIAIAISLALLAYGLRLLESENLWDYLIDPWLAGYAIFVALRRRPVSRQVDTAPNLGTGKAG
jgi:hypothetical protein